MYDAWLSSTLENVAASRQTNRYTLDYQARRVAVKDSRKVQNLLGVGLDSELAQKAVEVGFTLARLRRASKYELAQHFGAEELDSICEAVKRKPIPEETLQRLVEECD